MAPIDGRILWWSNTMIFFYPLSVTPFRPCVVPMPTSTIFLLVYILIMIWSIYVSLSSDWPMLAQQLPTHPSIIQMLIHKLELYNFKSYYGKHIIGPFDKHFTCIIGPNGNGKSNIIDAMLFVFGFKSFKLRQDSLTALIHRSAISTPD